MKYKIFKLKYGNTKLANGCKYKKITLAIVPFVSTCLHYGSIALYHTSLIVELSKQENFFHIRF